MAVTLKAVGLRIQNIDNAMYKVLEYDHVHFLYLYYSCQVIMCLGIGGKLNPTKTLRSHAYAIMAQHTWPPGSVMAQGAN